MNWGVERRKPTTNSNIFSCFNSNNNNSSNLLATSEVFLYPTEMSRNIGKRMYVCLN